MRKTERQIIWIFLTGVIMLTGLILFKYIPMSIYGQNILFDASAHVVWTMFILYFGWFFIDQDKNMRIFYFIISVGILVIISIQRIIAHEHNEVGILLGFLVGSLGILIPRWKEFLRNLEF